jgi:predicted nucleotidyltransferase component of viral defense system
MGKTILTSKQQLLLNLLFSNHNIRDNFYLTGGTALAEYYLKHRYSEDLDFFSPEEVDPMPIQVILKSISGKAQIRKIDYQQSFNRNLFFLHFEDEITKT